jgi:hypothetical protein
LAQRTFQVDEALLSHYLLLSTVCQEILASITQILLGTYITYLPNHYFLIYAHLIREQCIREEKNCILFINGADFNFYIVCMFLAKVTRYIRIISLQNSKYLVHYRSINYHGRIKTTLLNLRYICTVSGHVYTNVLINSKNPEKKYFKLGFNLYQSINVFWLSVHGLHLVVI